MMINFQFLAKINDCCDRSKGPCIHSGTCGELLNLFEPQRDPICEDFSHTFFSKSVSYFGQLYILSLRQHDAGLMSAERVQVDELIWIINHLSSCHPRGCLRLCLLILTVWGGSVSAYDSSQHVWSRAFLKTALNTPSQHFSSYSHYGAHRSLPLTVWAFFAFPIASISTCANCFMSRVALLTWLAQYHEYQSP